MNLTPEQIRTARIALGWEEADLARRAAISVALVQALEAGQPVDGASAVRVRAALQAEGAFGTGDDRPVSPAGLAEVRRDPFDG